MSVEEDARAAEYRRSQQARMDNNLRLENLTRGSVEADAALHDDFNPLLPDTGWNPTERTFIREDDIK